MLPSSVFAARAVWADEFLDISASEVFSDGFSFCVADKRRKRFEVRPERFEFWFWGLGTKAYDTLSVSAFELDGLRFRTRDAAFLKRFRQLMREYLEYIDIKLNTDESGLTQALTGRDFGSAYSESYAEWLAAMNAGEEPAGEILPCEIAAALDCPARWNAPVSPGLYGRPPTHIYIGSEVCPRLFPDDRTLLRLLNCGLKPVVCFPPLPERETDEYLRRARLLPEQTEVCVNDIGTALLLRDMGFKLIRGMCFERGTRDPRAPGDCRECGEPEFYREYLAGLGLTDLRALYLPLYRVNTSLLCPLRALVETGRRGEQKYSAECPGYCAKQTIFYPDGMRMIGRFNSLYGFDDMIKSPARINAALRNGVTRLVINA